MEKYGLLVSIKKDGSEGAEFPVTKNEISVGSLASCDLRLTIAGVEQTHCTLLVHPNSSALLRNFSTKNPVLVNGKPVEKNALLQDGDKISILHRTFMWRMSSSKADKTSRKSIATCVPSPGITKGSGRRKSEPIQKQIAYISPVRRSIDSQSPGFGTTRLSEASPSDDPATSLQDAAEALSQNVTVRRKVLARTSAGSVKRLSRKVSVRKSILRSATTPHANKSVRFDQYVNENTPQNTNWNVSGTARFNASMLSSSGNESLSLIDLTNMTSSEFRSYSEDESKISEYLSTPGRSFKTDVTELETSPQSAKVAVRFDESSARELLSPFNTRKSSMRKPATPFVRSATKPLISFETPIPPTEVSSLISFETPATASAITTDTSLISFDTPTVAGSVSGMKSTAQRKKTPFKPGSSAKIQPASGQSAKSPYPLRRKLLCSPKLKIISNKTLKPKANIEKTPVKGTQLIRLKKKPVQATPVLNLQDIFKTPGKQPVAQTPVSTKKPSAKFLPIPALNLEKFNETPAEDDVGKTCISVSPDSNRVTPASLYTPRGFSLAHQRSHLRNSTPAIDADLLSGVTVVKTPGTSLPRDSSKSSSVKRPLKRLEPKKYTPASIYTPRGFSPAHERSHLRSGTPATDSDLRSRISSKTPKGKTPLKFESKFNFKTPGGGQSRRSGIPSKLPKSKTPLKFERKFNFKTPGGGQSRIASKIPDAKTPLKFAAKFSFKTPGGAQSQNLPSVVGDLKSANNEIVENTKLISSYVALTPITGLQTSNGVTATMKTPRSARLTRQSNATPNNVSKTPLVALQKLKTPINEASTSAVQNGSLNAETSKNTTFTEVDIASPEREVFVNTVAVETSSKYSPGQTVLDLDFTNDLTVPPKDQQLQDSDTLLNVSADSRVTRKSVPLSEESQLLNSPPSAPKTRGGTLSKTRTPVSNKSTSSPFIDCSNIFKTPMKTPAKNTRSSTARKADDINRTLIESTSKKAKSLTAQSTPKTDEGLSVSVAFRDVCETPSKTPIKMFNSTVAFNDETSTMSGSGFDKTLLKSSRSHGRSLRSTTTIDDATITISACDNTFDVEKSAKSETPSKNLEKNTSFAKSCEELCERSTAEESTAQLSAQTCRNESSMSKQGSDSPANISYRTTRNSTVLTSQELPSILSEEEEDDDDDVTFENDLTDVPETLPQHLQGRVTRNSTFDVSKAAQTPSGILPENSQGRITRNSTFDISKTIQTPSKTLPENSQGRVTRNSTFDVSKTAQTPSETLPENSQGRITRNSTFDVSKTIQAPTGISLNEARSCNVSIPAISINASSPEKSRLSEHETSARILNQTYSPEGKSVCDSKARKSLNKTSSPMRSLATQGTGRKSYISANATQISVGTSDFSDSDENYEETSFERTENETYEESENDMSKKSSIGGRSSMSESLDELQISVEASDILDSDDSDVETSFEASEESLDSVIDVVSESPREVLKTPLKPVPSKSKTPARVKHNEPESPMLDLADTFKTPSKTPAKITGQNKSESPMLDLAEFKTPSETPAKITRQNKSGSPMLDLAELKTPSETPAKITRQNKSGSPMLDLSEFKTPSKTPAKITLQNESESPMLDLADFKTPSKTPAKITCPTEPESPMLDLAETFKTPLKTPAKVTRQSVLRDNGVSETSKTPVKASSSETGAETGSYITPASNQSSFKKTRTALTRSAVSPGIASRVDELYVNANLYETELNYEESILPSTKKSKTPARTNLSEIGSKVVSASNAVNNSSPIVTKDTSSASLRLDLFDIFKTPVKTTESIGLSRKSSSATPSVDFGKVISSALNTANDVENFSFTTPSKVAERYSSLNRSVGSPLAEVSVCQMLNKSNTPAKLNRSLTKKNVYSELLPKRTDSAKTPKKALNESGTISESENTSELSDVSSVVFREPMPPKKSRKSSVLSLAEQSSSSSDISVSNIATIELTALTASGGKLKTKVLKKNTWSPILLDKLFEKSRSKLQSPPGSKRQNTAEPCDVTPGITTVGFNAGKAPTNPTDVALPGRTDRVSKTRGFSSKKPTAGPSRERVSSDDIDEEPELIRSILKKRKSLLKRLSGSSSRRSSGSGSRRNSFVLPKKRLSTGKAPKRTLRFHPDILSTPEVENVLCESSDEDESIFAKRSTAVRKSRPSNRRKSSTDEEVPDVTTKKPARKSVRAPKPQPVSTRSKRASKVTADENPVVPAKKTKLSVELSGTSRPQRQSRRTINEPEVESEVVDNLSSAGKKRRSVQAPAESGAKRKKAMTAETETPALPRRRQTRAVAAKKPAADEELVNQEELLPAKRGRPRKQKTNDAQTDDDVEPSTRKTRSTVVETPENESIEQNASKQNIRSTRGKQNSKIAVETVEIIEETPIATTRGQRKAKQKTENTPIEKTAVPPSRKTRSAAPEVEIIKEVAVTQTRRTRKTRVAAETVSEPEEDVVEETAPTRTGRGRRKAQAVTEDETVNEPIEDVVEETAPTRTGRGRRRAQAVTEDETANESVEEVVEETAPVSTGRSRRKAQAVTEDEPVEVVTKTRSKASVKKPTAKSAVEETLTIQETQSTGRKSTVRSRSSSQQTEQKTSPLRKRTTKNTKKTQTPSPVSKRKTRSSNVASTSQENQANVSPQRKTRAKVVTQKRVSIGKRVTRSRK